MYYEFIAYGLLLFYTLVALFLFFGLEIDRRKQELEFNILQIIACLGWPIMVLWYFIDWIQSKWRK